MKLRFQADNDLDQRIVTATRRLDVMIDFQTAVSANLHGVADEEVLRLAAKSGRILVSHDRRTLPAHLVRFIEERNSPGVILISRRISVGRAAEWLYLLWAASEMDEYENIIYDLP